VLFTALVENALAHWLLDVAKIAAALVGIGMLLVGIDRVTGRRVSRGVRDTYRRAFTEPRDQRFAQTVHRVMKPELDEIREEHRAQLTAVKQEVRGVIESHTVEELAGVTRQIEVAERIAATADEALELSKSNGAQIARLVEAVGLTPKESS